MHMYIITTKTLNNHVTNNTTNNNHIHSTYANDDDKAKRMSYIYASRIVVIFYPFSQFCEIDGSLQSL